ncbi:hypothetical protein CYMTET_25563, partial [Cymbomonas tetramitiformis]
VGVTGFCMGGALTFGAAAKGADVACIAPFYGIPDPKYFDTTAIKIPVQAHFGQLDALAGFSDPETAQANFQKMKDAGCDIELCMYESGGHGFMNFGVAGGEEKLKLIGAAIPTQDDVDLAWKRLVAFFNQNLS